MKILSITAQKPHSTGSGTYLTELVRSWAAAGHEQAVVCGIYPNDTVSFPDGVSCYPVFFTDTAADSAAGRAEAAIFSMRTLNNKPNTGEPIPPILPFPITGMSDIMPYTSTRYRDMTPEMIGQFEEAFMGAVSRAVADLDPDLIVCHHLFLLTAMVRKHFPDRRIYGISHGTDLRQMLNCLHLAEMIRTEIAKLDRLLALHEDQRQRIQDIFDMSSTGSRDYRTCNISDPGHSDPRAVPEPLPERVKVIGSGYNDKLFYAGLRHSREEISMIAGCEAPVMICYAGKMSRPKGVPELLRVLEMLADDPDVPPFEVTLAGGCQDEEVKKQLDTICASHSFTYSENLPDTSSGRAFSDNTAAAESDSASRPDASASVINWVGQIPQERLADIFRYSDIFVLPSYFEGLPLVLIEAMASGMIPVSTDLPGVRPWVESNVPDHNIRFIEMPEMAAIDQPTEAGREKFVKNLHETLRRLITSVYSGTADRSLPDTSGITWDSVAGRVLTP